MSEVVVVVDMQVTEGRADEVITAFSAAMAPTHAEEGCLRYALHRDTNDPDHLVLIEKWTSQAAVEAHMAAPHFATLIEATSDPTLYARKTRFTFLAPLGLGDATKGVL